MASHLLSLRVVGNKLIFNEADNKCICLMCFITLGMTEILTREDDCESTPEDETRR